MKTAEIIVSIHSVCKDGDPTKSGPEKFPEYASAAGVSLSSTRPEGVTVDDQLLGNWRYDKELGGVGFPPCRKRVEIQLPDGVSFGPYQIANCEITGLHGEHAAKDGMGKAVYCYCKDAWIIQNETFEQAIDRAIASGIVLSIPDQDGKRNEVGANVIAISGIY